jgi:predicted dehydrogenase
VAKQHNVNLAAVGLQGRFDATVETLKDILAQGRIGEVLSTTITSQALIAGQSELEKQTYLLDRDSGGSLLSIPASHLLDTVQEGLPNSFYSHSSLNSLTDLRVVVLGEFASVQSILANQRPQVKILRADGSVLEESAKKSAPDHIMLQGTLTSGAVFSATVRGGSPFKDTPGLVWSIYGERGEVKVLGPSAFIELAGTSSIELYDFGKGVVEQIEYKKGTFDEFGPLSRNVARVYEATAAGDKSLLCDFEGAVKRHEFIDEVYRQNPVV